MHGMGFKPDYDFITGRKLSNRKRFKDSTRKKEWNKAAGREESDYKSTSKCRKCKTKLIWKGGGYDFDHKDNNPARNTQRNCWLVCKNCHGKNTKLGKKRVTSFIGTTYYKTYKKKVGYKKSTRPKKRKGKRKRKKSGGYSQLGFNLV